jgi:hypothetical protein
MIRTCHTIFLIQNSEEYFESNNNTSKRESQSYGVSNQIYLSLEEGNHNKFQLDSRTEPPGIQTNEEKANIKEEEMF